ncbi:TonB-dependent receptor [Kordia zhangzhouensis]|uniref:TonB-dependent receptor n=1 Tax=Kordia zhangzhouensis TaxID=1620405 RepID=UPI00069B1E9B|nr:TonB-dependent receptor [Kordia zhangzhouensis]
MSTKPTQAILFFIVLLAAMNSMLAQHILKGIVIDAATQIPINEATVFNVTTNNRVQTNKKGVFSIHISNENDIVEVSHNGYDTQQITFSITSNNRIALLPKGEALDVVMINGITIEQRLKEATDAVSIVSKREINSENTLQLAPILNRVPGVFMQSGSLNTNRITIRGIGARSPFGTANIRAYYADIPLTDGNGESAIEDLELATISRMEIHKGPASSSYGVGLGGTILWYPEYARFQETRAKLYTSVGSFGVFKTIAQVAHGGTTAHMNVTYSNTHSDGYRDNNSLDKASVTLTSNWLVNDTNELTFIGNYTSLKAFIPSSLRREDFENNPQSAATSWQQAQGFEDATHTLLGVNWKHDYNETYTQKTSVFTSLKNNYEPRPFNILKEEATTFGIRTRLIAFKKYTNSSLKWTIGGELFFEGYKAKQFENLYQDFPEGTGSVAGTLVSNLDEDRNYFNLFGEAIYTYKKLSISAGMHLNRTIYTVKDLLSTTQEKKEFTFNGILSPKLGVNYEAYNNLNLFATVAHGFSTPTTSETLLPDGVFNPRIKAERGWNYEIGARFHTDNRKLSGAISLYTMKVSDLLVNRRTETDQNITLNAGKTTHNGIEVALQYIWFQHHQYTMSSYINASLTNYSFKDFTETDANFSGNDLTGVPKSVVNLGVEITSQKGFYGRLDFQAVGKMPANDANTVYNDAYELLSGKIGYQNLLGSKLGYDISFGTNNIFNTKYASQLQVNAFGSDTTARYFYPGLPLHMYGSVEFTYRL